MPEFPGREDNPLTQKELENFVKGISEALTGSVSNAVPLMTAAIQETILQSMSQGFATGFAGRPVVETAPGAAPKASTQEVIDRISKVVGFEEGLPAWAEEVKKNMELLFSTERNRSLEINDVAHRQKLKQAEELFEQDIQYLKEKLKMVEMVQKAGFQVTGDPATLGHGELQDMVRQAATSQLTAPGQKTELAGVIADWSQLLNIGSGGLAVGAPGAAMGRAALGGAMSKLGPIVSKASPYVIAGTAGAAAVDYGMDVGKGATDLRRMYGMENEEVVGEAGAEQYLTRRMGWLSPWMSQKDVEGIFTTLRKQGYTGSEEGGELQKKVQTAARMIAAFGLDPSTSTSLTIAMDKLDMSVQQVETTFGNLKAVSEATGVSLMALKEGYVKLLTNLAPQVGKQAAGVAAGRFDEYYQQAKASGKSSEEATAWAKQRAAGSVQGFEGRTWGLAQVTGEVYPYPQMYAIFHPEAKVQAMEVEYEQMYGGDLKRGLEELDARSKTDKGGKPSQNEITAAIALSQYMQEEGMGNWKEALGSMQEEFGLAKQEGRKDVLSQLTGKSEADVDRLDEYMGASGFESEKDVKKRKKELDKKRKEASGFAWGDVWTAVTSTSGAEGGDILSQYDEARKDRIDKEISTIGKERQRVEVILGLQGDAKKLFYTIVKDQGTKDKKRAGY